jgi:hypothetical protein
MSAMAMKARMSWPELVRSGQLKGLWVALDNCRYDQTTLQPIEGDVVDADEELTELCTRMREAGRTACAILRCDDDVMVEQPPQDGVRPLERRNLAR